MKILCILGTSYSRDNNFYNYYMAPGEVSESCIRHSLYDKELIHPDARTPLYVHNRQTGGDPMYDFTDGTTEQHVDFINPDSTGGFDSFAQHLERKLIKLGLFDKVVNFSVGAFGINTYNARIFNILQQHKNDELSFLCEIPGNGRESIQILEEAYERWSQVSIDHYWKHRNDVLISATSKRVDEYFYEKHRLFWSGWAEGLTYDQLSGKYSKIKLSSKYKDLQQIAINNNDILPSPEMLYNWNKMKVITNKIVEKEDIIMQSFVINQFLKSNNYNVAWWSLDIDYFHDIDFLNDTSQSNCFDSVTDKFMLDIILKKYNRAVSGEMNNDKNNNLDLFPDGSHPTSLILKRLVDEYFVPYYNK